MVDNQLNVAEEIQQEEVVHSQESNTSNEEIESSSQESNSDKEQNFRRLREEKEKIERENQELREWKNRYSQPKAEEKEVENDYGIDREDIVEGQALINVYKKLEALEKRYENEKAASIPDRLKSKFSDFESVVSKENIDKLKQMEPEIFASLTAGSDVYAKGVSAYKTLKALGIAKSQNYKAEKEQVATNQGKPVSAQAIRGQGALSEANIFAKGLTPELRKQLQKEMQESAKGY